MLVLVPDNARTEVEAVLENKDIGFVKAGQVAEIKLDTFPFTRYGVVPAKVAFVSGDAIQDEKRGYLFQARLALDQDHIQVDGRSVRLSPGMTVAAEIKTGRRRVIEYFLDPVTRNAKESLGER
ncbi:HlyD family efflux transporter periplasmic adaptor subunit [Niveibacterium sp. SC-1]|uniref:HlyD family efflux transporter periplasmic adaptor subunit n=1 Tax=Niveibacterium sp. SC-1 TaxID=3135646 RepID=UPI00311D3135